MKTIRENVFETNSSSTHSMTIMEDHDYERWKKEPDACYDENTRKIISTDQRSALIKKDIIEYRQKYHPDRILDKITDEEIESYFRDNLYEYPLTYAEYLDACDGYLDYDVNHYTTQSNDKIVILCKYGHD